MPNTNFMLRGLTESELSTLDALAHNSHTSRQEYVLTLIRQHISDSPANVILGYIRIDRRGDLDADTECPECGQDLKEPYLWFRADNTFGVVCSGCATSE